MQYIDKYLLSSHFRFDFFRNTCKTVPLSIITYTVLKNFNDNLKRRIFSVFTLCYTTIAFTYHAWFKGKVKKALQLISGSVLFSLICIHFDRSLHYGKEKQTLELLDY